MDTQNEFNIFCIITDKKVWLPFSSDTYFILNLCGAIETS